MTDMSLSSLTSFNAHNRRQLFNLIALHLLWSMAVLAGWAVSLSLPAANAWWSTVFLMLQLFAAAQLLLPLLRMQPQERGRFFYLFWGGALVFLVWLVNRFAPGGPWQPVAGAFASGLLLLAGALVGISLARFVKRLWEILPLCLVMSLADFSSWLFGPTADFARQIENHYRDPIGPPPLVDILLVKLAVPGAGDLIPVFGVADWIVAVFFVGVAQRHGFNDNLLGTPPFVLSQQQRLGRYLPLSIVALFAAVMLAHSSGLFIPALPLIALVMLIWFGVATFVNKERLL
jgi:hypothetical protein